MGCIKELRYEIIRSIGLLVVLCLAGFLRGMMRTTGSLAIYTLDMSLFAISLVIAYTINYTSGEFGTWSNSKWHQFICSGNACGSIMVYKLMIGFGLYHFVNLFIFCCKTTWNPHSAKVFREGCLVFKLICFLLCMFASIFIPNGIIEYTYFISFVLALLAVLYIAIYPLFFAYGIQSIILKQRNRVPISLSMKDDDDDDSNNKGRNERNTHHGSKGGDLEQQMTMVNDHHHHPDDSDIMNSARKSSNIITVVLFISFTLILLGYVLVVSGWLFDMIVFESECRVNFFIIIIYVAFIVLSTIMCGLSRRQSGETNVFVLSVLMSTASYFIWNAQIMLDPLQCNQKIHTGEGMHIFTVIAGFVIFFVLISYTSIPVRVKTGDEYINMVVSLHLIYILAFVYLSLVSINWSHPIEIEGMLMQKQSLMTPAMFHYLGLIILFLVFIGNLFPRLVFSRNTTETTVSSL